MDLGHILEDGSLELLTDIYVGHGVMFWLGKKEWCLLLKLGKQHWGGIQGFLSV